jgi:hypothetical protein
MPTNVLRPSLDQRMNEWKKEKKKKKKKKKKKLVLLLTECLNWRKERCLRARARSEKQGCQVDSLKLVNLLWSQKDKVAAGLLDRM